MLLFLAWLVNVAILCCFGGLRAGLITGFVVMPVMWMLCFGSAFSLLNVYEHGRASLDPYDALKRGDYTDLEATTSRETAESLFFMGVVQLDALESSSSQVRLGYSVTFWFEKEVPKTPGGGEP